MVQINYTSKMMNIIKVKNYEEMSKKAANYMEDLLKENSKLNACYAVGGTSIGMFNELIRKFHEGKVNFKDTKAFVLDEYCNNTYHIESGSKYFLQTYFLNKVNIKSYNIFSPNADQEDLEEACRDYDQLLSDCGIDVAILGIGANGHIAYNEPNTSFDSLSHISKLEFKTRWDRQRFFGNNIAETPTHALTMGIKNIMNCKKILLLISGADKNEAFKRLINGEVNEAFPASILLRHSDVTIIVDEAAYA